MKKFHYKIIIVFDLYFKDYININQIKNNEDNLSQSVKSGKNFFDEESSITTFDQTSNNSKNLLTFEFKTIDQLIIFRIQIEENKTFGELRKLFFEKIKRPDLFGEPSIFFVCEAEVFTLKNSKELIKNYFTNKDRILLVTVFDQEDKIK